MRTSGFERCPQVKALDVEPMSALKLFEFIAAPKIIEAESAPGTARVFHTLRPLKINYFNLFELLFVESYEHYKNTVLL